MGRRHIFRIRTAASAAAFCAAFAILSGCVTFDRCGPRECPADAKISAEVRDLFAHSPGLGAPNLIDVQTVRGVVYLRGVVSTPYLVEEAPSIAAQAPGVVRVQNLLTIDNSR